MKRLTFSVLALALALASGAALADHDHRRGDACDLGGRGPAGFGNGLQAMTIAAARDQARDDQLVVIKGRLTKSLGDERFEFSDAAGDTIVVKLDDDRDWSMVGKDMPIEIVAEVDKEMFGLELEAKCARPDDGKLPPPAGNGPRGF